MKERDKGTLDQLIRENVPLAPLTTLGIGGPARYFIQVKSVELLPACVNWARERGLPIFVLAGGSNIVVADEGFSGLVLQLKLRGVQNRLEDGYAVVSAGASEEWDPLVETCVSQDWGGFECLSGIPGTVGATPIQNVGAYGQDISETFVSLSALDLRTGQLVDMTGKECDFGYRSSRFRTVDRGRFIITAVTYRLSINASPATRYAELQHYFANQQIDAPRLSEVRQAVLALRRRKAMVIDPNDPDSRSVGSFFMNPVVTLEEYERLQHRTHRITDPSDEMPSWPVPDGRKLSAAWLIERAGFSRGYGYGNVGLSAKHSLAIVNRGGGSAREVVELAVRIRSRVEQQFGVALRPEPIFVGFADSAGPEPYGS